MVKGFKDILLHHLMRDLLMSVRAQVDAVLTAIYNILSGDAGLASRKNSTKV